MRCLDRNNQLVQASFGSGIHTTYMTVFPVESRRDSRSKQEQYEVYVFTALGPNRVCMSLCMCVSTCRHVLSSYFWPFVKMSCMSVHDFSSLYIYT